jgi:hypothetical protein
VHAAAGGLEGVMTRKASSLRCVTPERALRFWCKDRLD